jgi:predicted nucleotide-binding protein (sugar kinase/HSP70/actin superfamily)
MAPHVEVVAAAMEAYGTRVVVLPESDQRSLHYSNQLTSGTECLPYRITLGDFMKFYYDEGIHGEEFEGFMAGAYGPCRFGKYAIEQARALKEIGFYLPIRTAVSNNAYRDLNLGQDFERLAWKGIVAMDCLERLVWRTRPYEKQLGSADQLFTEYTRRLADCIRRKDTVDNILRQATDEFSSLIDSERQRKPLVGINGEIYLRSNKFSNNDLVRVCEEAGLEVVVSPMGEWFRYTSHRSVEDALRSRNIKKIIRGYLKKMVQEHDEGSVANLCRDLLDEEEPSTAEILKSSSEYLSSQCGSEAVLSIGSGIRWMQNPKFSGAISVMPHGCMPGGIVAAMLDKFSTIYQKPWISLTYDGFAETNNLARINNFAEVIRYCSKENQAEQLDSSVLLGISSNSPITD